MLQLNNKFEIVKEARVFKDFYFSGYEYMYLCQLALKLRYQKEVFYSNEFRCFAFVGCPSIIIINQHAPFTARLRYDTHLHSVLLRIDHNIIFFST